MGINDQNIIDTHEALVQKKQRYKRRQDAIRSFRLNRRLEQTIYKQISSSDLNQEKIEMAHILLSLNAKKNEQKRKLEPHQMKFLRMRSYKSFMKNQSLRTLIERSEKHDCSVLLTKRWE